MKYCFLLTVVSKLLVIAINLLIYFWHPWNELKFFYSVPPSSLGCMPSFLSFLSLYEFSIIFSVKTAHSTPRTWHNMFLVFKYLQFWDLMSGWPYQLTCKIWGHSEYVKKLTSFSGDRSGRTEGPVRKEFFSTTFKRTHIFYSVPPSSLGCMKSFLAFLSL